MKKHLCSILTAIFFSSTISFAQPVITQDDLIDVGGTYRISLADTSGIEVGDSGANVTWDFSNLQRTEVDSFETPLIFTRISLGDAIFSDSFPEATFAEVFEFETPEGSFRGENFYIANGNEFTSLGQGNSIEIPGLLTETTISRFDDPATFLVFPFSFNSTFTDKSSLTVETEFLGFNSSFTTNSEDTILVDAFGTLILPSGTFNDVLRVVIRSRMTDISEGDLGTDTTGSSSTSYVWIKDDLPSVLLGIDIVEEGDSTFTTVTFREEIITSIQADLSEEVNLQLFPNPTANLLGIQYNLPNTEEVKLEIFDMQGRQLKSLFNDRQIAGFHESTFAIGDLAAGVYMLRISLSGKADFQKFVKK